MERNDLDRYIHALETQNRRLRQLVRLAAVLVGILLCFAVAGWKSGGVQDVVRARSFELVNHEGVMIGQFARMTDGGGKLTAFNADGSKSVEVASVNKHGGIYCFDSTGRVRFAAGPVDKAPDLYALAIDCGSGPRLSSRTIYLGDIDGRSMGIQIYNASLARDGMELLVKRDGTSAITLKQPLGGTSSWTGFQDHSELTFANFEAESRTDTRFVSTVEVNRPAGKVTSSKLAQNIIERWPKD
jgi:hypothetical protein